MNAQPNIQLLPTPDPLQSSVKAWLNSIQAAGASPHTVNAYERDLRTVLQHLPLVTVQELTPLMLDRAVATLTGSPSSIQRTRAALRAWGRWLELTDQVQRNPARAIKTKRLPSAPPDYLSDAEVKRLLKTVRQTDTATARRDRVWLEVMLWTGIRVGELVSLNVDDIDLETKHLRVRVKGGAIQTKFLKTELRTLLKTYIKARKGANTQQEALFLSNQGTRLTVRQIERQLKHWLTAAGIQKRLGPHGLRHTFATNLYGRTRDILMVQRALGHANVETTTRYAHMSTDTLQDAIDAL